MKHLSVKLVISALALVLTLILVISATYAWLVLSKSPAANGISISLGGGSTILVAPDMVSYDSDGTAVHYPGKFDDFVDFAKYSTYDYLKNAEGLSPVSTSDGINWIIPTYEDGILNEIEKFELDNTLSNASVNGAGHYCYLDFWVVSPGNEYELRVSMDDQILQGSFAVEKPAPVSENGSYRLSMPGNGAASNVRIGFLVNNENAGDAAMIDYSASEYYNRSYDSLLGVYSEPGGYQSANSAFTIFEPNADMHPAKELQNGAYYITYPLSYDLSRNLIFENTSSDVSNHLAVQLSNKWKNAETVENPVLDPMEAFQIGQSFKAAIAGRSFGTPDGASDYFYNTYLQNNIDYYVESGKFIKNTDALYSNATVTNGVAESGVVSSLLTAGASDSAVITRLEKNTPVRVRMFIWLEGQDIDCNSTNGVRSSEIAIKLELAGS